MEKDLSELQQEIILSNENSGSMTTWVNNPYIKAATSNNTRIAYQNDIRHFESWGGKLPASVESISRYLQDFAKTLNSRTLSRRLTALKHWHTYQGFSDPTQHPAIVKTMSGITRIHGKPKEKAPPLELKDLLSIVKHLKYENSLTSYRDNAILQIGFFGALRRSELVAIQLTDIYWKDQGIEILIPKSKTDQTNIGQYCAIPFGKDILCPVTALKIWLEKSNIKEGPIFREIKKGGVKLSDTAISPLTVNYILKKCAKKSGIAYADQLSSHSLRRGLATSASLAGANIAAIMRQGRWKQVNTVMEYIEASARFSENVASVILQDIDV